MANGLLQKSILKSPACSGIYIFSGKGAVPASGRGPAFGGKFNPLYIGKASNLKARLLSYLKTKDVRLQKMLSLAKNIKVVETDSEIEALILESQYIKKYKPAFNIMLRDDKQYGFVGFTNEKFPKIFITHQPGSRNSSGFQPNNLSKDKLHLEFSLPGKPGSEFLRYNLPSKLSRQSQLKNLLPGQPSQNLKTYKLKNLQTNYIGPFTDIGALKTTLRYLRRIFPYCTCKKPHNNFCLNYHIDKCLGFCCRKNLNDLGFKIYDLRMYEKNIKVLKEILSGKKNSLLRGLEKEMITLGKKERFQEAIELRDKIEKIKRVFENAVVIQHNANLQMHANATNVQHYDSPSYHSEAILADLKKVLGLEKIPARIEGYDVANIQGKYAVGVMVVFTDGKPNKNEYRKFKIHSPKSSDDVKRLKEVLERRFNHPEWPLPDLILVDGGKAQLNAAHSVIFNLQFTIYKQAPNSKPQIPKVIALTKNEKHKGEKIYVSGRKTAIPLLRLPVAVKNLLLQVDSEAHRFAISYYRRLHRRTIK